MTTVTVREITSLNQQVRRALLQPVEALLDTQAQRYAVHPIGSDEATLDTLARMVVDHDQIEELAVMLEDPLAPAAVLAKIYPYASGRISVGELLVTRNALTGAVEKTLNTTSQKIITIYTSLMLLALAPVKLVADRGYTEFTVTTHDGLFPNYRRIHDAILAQRVHDVLAMLRFDPDLRVKKLSTAVLAEMIRDNFLRAANELRSVIITSSKIAATFHALRARVLKEPMAIPAETMVAPELSRMERNWSLVAAALEAPMVPTASFSADTYNRYISEVNALLTQSKVLKITPLAAIKAMFSHTTFTDPNSQRVQGLVVAKNFAAESSLQLLRFARQGWQNMELYTMFTDQMAEAQVTALLAPLARDPQLTTAYTISLVRNLASQADRNEFERGGRVIKIGDISESELTMLALAWGASASIETPAETNEPMVTFSVQAEGIRHYRPVGPRIGNLVNTTDPAEALLIIAPGDYDGEGVYGPDSNVIPAKFIQAYLAEDYSRITTPLSHFLREKIKVGDKVYTMPWNLEELLAFPRTAKWSVVVPLALQRMVTTKIQAIQAIRDHFKEATPTDQWRAVAANLAAAVIGLLRPIFDSPTGQSVIYSMGAALMRELSADIPRAQVVSVLATGRVWFQLRVTAAVLALRATGALSADGYDVILQILSDVDTDALAIHTNMLTPPNLL